MAVADCARRWNRRGLIGHLAENPCIAEGLGLKLA
jgi:hypothetical protein